jgi:hypothetical protein
MSTDEGPACPLWAHSARPPNPKHPHQEDSEIAAECAPNVWGEIRCPKFGARLNRSASSLEPERGFELLTCALRGLTESHSVPFGPSPSWSRAAGAGSLGQTGTERDALGPNCWGKVGMIGMPTSTRWDSHRAGAVTHVQPQSPMS